MPSTGSKNDGLGALDPFPARVAAGVGRIRCHRRLAWGGLTGLDSVSQSSGLVCELDQGHGKSTGGPFSNRVLPINSLLLAQTRGVGSD
jgi:hypothetical protein